MKKPRFRTLRDIYDVIPRIECKGLCSGSCGPVPATRKEVIAIEKAAGGKRFCTDASLNCTMLRDGRCTVYEQRPLLCRAWGVVQSMPCPWGCVPERWMSDAESTSLLHLAAALGDGYDMKRIAGMLEAVTDVLPEVNS